jgi:hypothetical protein
MKEKLVYTVAEVAELTGFRDKLKKYPRPARALCRWLVGEGSRVPVHDGFMS